MALVCRSPRLARRLAPLAVTLALAAALALPAPGAALPNPFAALWNRVVTWFAPATREPGEVQSDAGIMVDPNGVPISQ